MLNIERESAMRENRQRRPLAQRISTAVVLPLTPPTSALVGGKGRNGEDGVARADVTATPCEPTSAGTTALTTTAGTTSSLPSTETTSTLPTTGTPSLSNTVGT